MLFFLEKVVRKIIKSISQQAAKIIHRRDAPYGHRQRTRSAEYPKGAKLKISNRSPVSDVKIIYDAKFLKPYF